MVVHVAHTSAPDAAVAWDGATNLIKDVEDWAALAKREARKSASRVKVTSTAALDSAHEEAEGLVRKMAHLEGELTEARRAQEVAEENSHAMSIVVADAEQQWEVSERECREHFEELTPMQTQGS
jgi:hypothetical protein